MNTTADPTDDYARDIVRVQSIDAVPKMLDVVCKATGMRFAAIARVSESRWICCAVRDEVDFGLVPGGELKVETTICHEIREHRNSVVISDVKEHSEYCGHATPAMYGFRSYISIPIFRTDNTFFGTLCAIDPKPAKLTEQIVDTFTLFAELIALQLDAADRLEASETRLANERKTAEFREQFIAVLGHDLRNPLASISAGANLLRRSTRADHDLQILDLMQNSVRRMARLVEDVMDFARGRLGSGLTLTKATTDIYPLLDHVVSELKSHNSHVQFELHVEVSFPVVCDGSRIEQLVSNLLANAVSYGDLSKQIKLDARTDTQHFELSVSNAGEQIPPDILTQLFSPFVRGTTNGGQGLGLGLYIASEIARAHGGRLTATSTDEETRFTFRMPLK